MPAQITARPFPWPSVHAGAEGHINNRVSNEMHGRRPVCDDCAGTGWDSSDYQIWCPACGGTGEGEVRYLVANTSATWGSSR